MLDIIFGSVALFFGILGAVALLRRLALSIAAPKRVKNRIYAVRLSGKSADIELQLAIETVHWDSMLTRSSCFAVDCGIDEEIKDYCKDICQKSDFTYITEREFSLLFT